MECRTQVRWYSRTRKIVRKITTGPAFEHQQHEKIFDVFPPQLPGLLKVNCRSILTIQQQQAYHLLGMWHQGRPWVVIHPKAVHLCVGVSLCPFVPQICCTKTPRSQMSLATLPTKSRNLSIFQNHHQGRSWLQVLAVLFTLLSYEFAFCPRIFYQVAVGVERSRGASGRANCKTLRSTACQQWAMGITTNKCTPP